MSTSWTTSTGRKSNTLQLLPIITISSIWPNRSILSPTAPMSRTRRKLLISWRVVLVLFGLFIGGLSRFCRPRTKLRRGLSVLKIGRSMGLRSFISMRAGLRRMTLFSMPKETSTSLFKTWDTISRMKCCYLIWIAFWGRKIYPQSITSLLPTS